MVLLQYVKFVFVLNQEFAVKDQSMVYILEITSMINMGELLVLCM